MKRLPCKCGGISVIKKEDGNFCIMCEECHARTEEMSTINDVEENWNELQRKFFDLHESESESAFDVISSMAGRYVIINMIEDVLYIAKHEKDFAKGMALYDAAMLLYDLWYEFMTIDERRSVLYMAEDAFGYVNFKRKKGD